MHDDEPFQPAARELCPDGACIGVIGSDGCCKECGTVAPSAVADPRHRGLKVDPDADRDEPFAFADRQLCPDGACIGVLGPSGMCGECGRSVADEAASAAPKDDPGDDGDLAAELEDRQLCPDGACIGVLGADGRCKECGATGS